LEFLFYIPNPFIFGAISDKHFSLLKMLTIYLILVINPLFFMCLSNSQYINSFNIVLNDLHKYDMFKCNNHDQYVINLFALVLFIY